MFATPTEREYMPSRQREVQLRYVARGCCQVCGKSRGDSKYKTKCKPCGIRRKLYQRQQLNQGQWVKGTRGRTPHYPEY